MWHNAYQAPFGSVIFQLLSEDALDLKFDIESEVSKTGFVLCVLHNYIKSTQNAVF